MTLFESYVAKLQAETLTLTEAEDSRLTIYQRRVLLQGLYLPEGSIFIQAPDTYNVATASITTEFLETVIANDTADPNPAESYWTCCVGDPQSEGMHYCEWKLSGEPSAVDSDAEAAMIGFINQEYPTPFSTTWFGSLENSIGVYTQNGRIYSNGGTGTYLRDPDGSVWTAADLTDKLGLVMVVASGTIEGYVYRVSGGGGSPGFCRNPDNSIPDPLTNSNPNFTLSGTTGQITIGDASASPDFRGIIVPTVDRAF